MSERICERCAGEGNYYVQIGIFGDFLTLIDCDDCNGTGKVKMTNWISIKDKQPIRGQYVLFCKPSILLNSTKQVSSHPPLSEPKSRRIDS